MSINPGLEKSLRSSVFIRVHLRTKLSILAATAAAISASTCLAGWVLTAIQPVEAVGQAVAVFRDQAGVTVNDQGFRLFVERRTLHVVADQLGVSVCQSDQVDFTPAAGEGEIFAIVAERWRAR